MLIDDLAKLNRSKRNSVSAALIIIAAIAIYNWTLAPHTSYLFAAQRYETAIDNIMKESKVVSNKVEIKKKKLQELRQQFAEFQNTLFTPSNATEFFSDLQPISEEAGCVVYSLNFATGEPVLKGEESENALGIVANSAMLSVVGMYGNVIKLVERIQARTQKVWIDSVRMEAVGDNPDQLKCDMTIIIYAIEDKEAALYE
ncbi:MAG: hypothetical protein ACYSWR_02765 [Planctomycetota bacterium]|jgi:hypothetical protein